MQNIIKFDTNSTRRREFNEGYIDFMRGVYFDNPYAKNTVKHREYQHGQDVAYLDCQKKAQQLYKAV